MNVLTDVMSTGLLHESLKAEAKCLLNNKCVRGEAASESITSLLLP